MSSIRQIIARAGRLRLRTALFVAAVRMPVRVPARAITVSAPVRMADSFPKLPLPPTGSIDLKQLPGWLQAARDEYQPAANGRDDRWPERAWCEVVTNHIANCLSVQVLSGHAGVPMAFSYDWSYSVRGRVYNTVHLSHWRHGQHHNALGSVDIHVSSGLPSNATKRVIERVFAWLNAYSNGQFVQINKDNDSVGGGWVYAARAWQIVIPNDKPLQSLVLPARNTLPPMPPLEPETHAADTPSGPPHRPGRGNH